MTKYIPHHKPPIISQCNRFIRSRISQPSTVLPCRTYYSEDQFGKLKYYAKINLHGYPNNAVQVSRQHNQVLICIVYDECNSKAEKCQHIYKREINFPPNTDPTTIVYFITKDNMLIFEADVWDKSTFKRVGSSKPRTVLDWQRPLSRAERHKSTSGLPSTDLILTPNYNIINSSSNSQNYRRHCRYRSNPTNRLNSYEHSNVRSGLVGGLSSIPSSPNPHYNLGKHPPKMIPIQHSCSATPKFGVSNQPTSTSSWFKYANSSSMMMEGSGGTHANWHTPKSNRFYSHSLKLGNQVKPENLQVHVKLGVLMIRVREFQQAADGSKPKILREIVHEHTIPINVDQNELKAKLENGVLVWVAPYLPANAPSNDPTSQTSFQNY